MTATDVLGAHHRDILDRFRDYRRQSRLGPRARRAAFEGIRRAIQTQVCLEEEMLYPALCGRPSPDAGRRLDRVLDAHLLLGQLLLSLAATPAHRPEFDVRMEALRRTLEEHLRLELDGPYRDARRRLPWRNRVSLGARIRARIDLLRRVAAVPA